MCVYFHFSPFIIYNLFIKSFVQGLVHYIQISYQSTLTCELEPNDVVAKWRLWFNKVVFLAGINWCINRF